MANCTPILTRKRLPLSPLDEILWNRDQDRQNSYIAAQEAARVRTQKIASILASFSFTLDEESTLYAFDRSCCYQVGMSVVSKTDTSERYLVIAKLLQEGEEWSCTCPPFHQEDGPLVIQAVQTRVEHNRQCRLQNAA